VIDGPRRRSFSEREGFRAPVEAIQVGGMTDELRNSLWNVIHTRLLGTRLFHDMHEGRARIYRYSESLWIEFFKKPVDSRPDSGQGVLAEISKFFFSCEWFGVYDFLEWNLHWVSNSHLYSYDYFATAINGCLERELAGYRFIGGLRTEITDKQEIEALGEALEDERFLGVRSHLHTALRLLSDRDGPDYRNSIKESISAVESMVKVVTGQPKASLGDALTDLEKRGRLHTALKKGFSRLYGYTNDEGGIRHAMLEEPELSAADAKYFLLSCTSFINYLKAKL